MSTTIIIKNTRPRISFANITQVGLKALHLVTVHQAVLAPRLPQGQATQLSADLGALGVVIPGATQATTESRVATSTYYAAIDQGLAHLRQIRKAVRRCGAPTEIKKAYGVGLHLRPRMARDVVALMQQILERAKQFPAEAESLGILKQDTDALEKERTAILDTDTEQDTKRANSPLATRERNQTANRILAAVARIEAAGRLEFAADEGTRPLFEALGKMSHRKYKAEATEKTGKTEAQATPV